MVIQKLMCQVFHRFSYMTWSEAAYVLNALEGKFYSHDQPKGGVCLKCGRRFGTALTVLRPQ